MHATDITDKFHPSHCIARQVFARFNYELTFQKPDVLEIVCVIVLPINFDFVILIGFPDVYIQA